MLEQQERDLDVSRQRYLHACANAAQRIDLYEEAYSVFNAITGIANLNSGDPP